MLRHGFRQWESPWCLKLQGFFRVIPWTSKPNWILESQINAFKGVRLMSSIWQNLIKKRIFEWYSSPAGQAVSQGCEVLQECAMLSGQKAKGIRALSSWRKHATAWGKVPLQHLIYNTWWLMKWEKFCWKISPENQYFPGKKKNIFFSRENFF